jgi:hypothetical protein
MPELAARLGGRDVPGDRRVLAIALALPGGDFSPSRRDVGEATAQALGGQHRSPARLRSRMGEARPGSGSTLAA